MKFCSATKNDQNAKNVSIITVCLMDRSTFFADVVKATFEDNMQTLLRRATRSSRTSSVNGFAAGSFFKVSYIILNTDYCCRWLNPLETTFMAKFSSKSSAADVPFISKRKTQNDFLTS